MSFPWTEEGNQEHNEKYLVHTFMGGGGAYTTEERQEHFFFSRSNTTTRLDESIFGTELVPAFGANL